VNTGPIEEVLSDKQRTDVGALALPLDASAY
jgi:hypothetical protein